MTDCPSTICFDVTCSPSGQNYCSTNNGGCTHLCLATPAGRSCRCPDNAVGLGCVERAGTNWRRFSHTTLHLNLVWSSVLKHAIKPHSLLNILKCTQNAHGVLKSKYRLMRALSISLTTNIITPILRVSFLNK